MLCFFFLFFVLLLTLYCDLFWQLAKQGEGKVFATDTIVATLMACARSQYSWDIVVTVMEETVIVLIVKSLLVLVQHVYVMSHLTSFAAY